MSLFRENVSRAGVNELLEWLERTDFFVAPASTRFHGAEREGLVKHSLNVYDVMVRRNEYDGGTESLESITVCALLHDLCKAEFYKESTRNVKNDETGKWEKVPYYTIEDRYPFGHGEKSVLLISDYMKLTREEAFAIRYHMGFTGTEDNRTIGQVFELYPLTLALFTADMEATFCMEKTPKK